MYSVKPKGINLRQNDRSVQDGFLQESINLQWRDGAIKPIPERLFSGITNTIDKQKVILHKVSDEDKINVLMFDSVGILAWYGTIENGNYLEKETSVVITNFPTVTDFETFSFAIPNGLLHFMSISQRFYYRLQFNENNQEYEVKDMYAWKDLIAYFPHQEDVLFNQASPPADVFQFCRCGIILIRFALVLKTGEIVLHSPIYPYFMYGLDLSTFGSLAAGDVIKNIHTFINMNMEYNDMIVFNDNISAINIYASVPFYKSEYTNISAGGSPSGELDSSDIRGYVQKSAESPFYLIKTIEEPTDDKILIKVDNLKYEPNSAIYSSVDATTIAAGEIMPVDNFTYHKLYGKLTSNNGRVINYSPTTVMSKGYIRSLAYLDGECQQGFEASTEDGTFRGISYLVDKTIEQTTDKTYYRGLLSYPDAQATLIGSNNDGVSDLRLFKSRANSAHNMACVFDFKQVSDPYEDLERNVADTVWTISLSYSAGLIYDNTDELEPPNTNEDDVSYDSNNRAQFSESGEFSVWPAINSYRIGEGRILFVGVNSIDPANIDYIAPLIIGTSDGVYTVNFDVTGTNLIQSITQTAKMPALSSENIQIDQDLIYVSDKGLIAISSGRLINLTKDYFQEQGNDSIPIKYNYLALDLASYLGGIPDHETIYPNYTLLTSDFFGEVNPYYMIDIVEYMKDAIFAYDSRRNNIWCSNPSKSFSLIFNFITKQWDMSTYVFSEKIEAFSIFSSELDDVYSRYLVKNINGELDILSGEDLNTEVFIHLLTRPIKMQSADTFKKIDRLIARCELHRASETSYFSLGIWGKQDINKNKVNIPLVAFKDASSDKYPNNIRQDIPVGRQKGKYKAITILQNGKALPSSSIDGYDIVALPVNNKTLR